MSSEEKEVRQTQAETETVYEPPKIESVMTPDDLRREVAYAGTTDFTLPVG